MKEKIIEKLKTVYDPEFPLVDMYTLGLIYDIDLKIKKKICDITMTFTTPTCPMADTIMELVKNAVLDVIPGWEVNIIVSFYCDFHIKVAKILIYFRPFLLRIRLVIIDFVMKVLIFYFLQLKIY